MSVEQAKHLTPIELAERLGVTARTLTNWRSNNTGPKYFKPTGNVVRYRLTDVDAWEAEMTQNPPKRNSTPPTREQGTGKFQKKD